MGESEESAAREGDAPATASMMGDWETAGSFFSSILAGLAVGWAADYFLGTEPWLVVLGVVAGSVIGFWRMVVYSERIVEQANNPRLQRLAKLRREMEDEDDT